jgi:hypothetical protein
LKAVARLDPLVVRQRSITSVGQTAHSRLTPSAKGRVHSAYRGAVNLLLPKGLVSVVPRSAGRGPLSLVLADWNPSKDSDVGFKTGQQVIVKDEAIWVGESERLSFAHAQVYRPSRIFNRNVLALDDIRRNVTRARDLIQSEGRLDGLGVLLPLIGGSPPVTSSNTSPFMSTALRSATRLVSALGSRDTREISRAGEGLLGLGIGLTPSGDDLLCGVCVALVLGSENGLKIPGGFQPVFAKIAHAGGRTTRLSQEYLEQASRGKANEKVTDFVSAVYTSNENDVVRSLSVLLAMGETSGTDTALGVILGVKTVLGEAGAGMV